MLPKLLIVTAMLFLSFYSWSQDSSSSSLNKVVDFPHRFFDKINAKTSSLDQSLTRQTEKFLQRLIKKEAKLRKKLSRVDTNAVKELFSVDPAQQYTALLKKLQSDSGATAGPLSGEYVSYIDSLKCSLGFLNQNPQLLSSSKVPLASIRQSFNNLQRLQAKMQDAAQIRQFIQQRKEQIKNCLSRYTNLPGHITNLYRDYNKQLYYYNQQITEYKAMLNDPGKMVKTALTWLNKVPAFTDFMKKNSMLASLLNIPGTMDNESAALAVNGLQTRDQVMTALRSQAGPNVPAIMQQNMQDARGQIDDLRNKLNSGSGELDMPGFKPNMQKSKRFLDRLEYGTNLQTVRSNYYFPSTTDLGLSLGYKLNDKNVIGVGVSYKVGWGSDISHINVSSQGVGFRSFADINVKKSFFMSGGFEYNYQQPFNSLSVVQDLRSWQQSGLLGASKIISLKTKTLKKTKIQLLWDFLSYQQVPRTPAVKFRIGYSF
jgi:hypothetical protein